MRGAAGVKRDVPKPVSNFANGGDFLRTICILIRALRYMDTRCLKIQQNGKKLHFFALQMFEARPGLV